MSNKYHNLNKYFIIGLLLLSLIIPVIAAPSCSFCEFINISKGDKGDPGVNGTDGYTPVLGVDYFNGTNGIDGYTPIFGVDYFNGSNGTNGYTPIFGVDYFNGSQGVNGTPGINGINGTSASISINATFTGLPGTMASVINIGNATNAALDFTIPQGYNGSTTSTSSVGGSLDTQVIYNNNMVANGSPCLIFNYTTLTLSACNITGDGTGITNVTANAVALSFDVREGGIGNIYKGQAVYISGSTGVNVRVLPADNTLTDNSRVVGLMIQDVTINGAGQVRRAGELTGVDTRPTNVNVNPLGQTWAAGDLLFATTGGGLTNVRPTSGRSVKVAYSLRGSHISDTLLAYPMENPVWLTAAGSEDVTTRLGDNIGVNKLSIRNYSNGEVAFVNSYGNASFNGIDNNLYRLTNVRDPVALQDAATRNFVNTVNSTMKSYVDSRGAVNDSYDTVANVSQYVIDVNNSMRNNVSQYVIAVNNTQTANISFNNNTLMANTSNYVIAVNNSMRNNVSEYVISVNSSMKSYVDSRGAVNDSYDTVTNVSQYVIAVNNSMRNNISQYVIAVNNTQTANISFNNNTLMNNVSQYVISVNNSMRNNVSEYVIAVNSSMKAYVDALPSGGDTSGFLFTNGSRWMGGNLNMSKFNVSNITSITGGDAVNLTMVTNMNTSMRNNVSEYVISVNNTMRNNVSQAIATTTNLSAVYPIGSIYITTLGTNPNTIFGGFGTWQDMGTGYVLVGV